MANFIVKTHNNRNLVIEADDLVVGVDEYLFYTAHKILASVPKHPSILAVLEEDAEADDYYVDYDDSDEDETDDVCLDCRLEEFLDSDSFVDTVLRIVNAWREANDEDLPKEAEVTD